MALPVANHTVVAPSDLMLLIGTGRGYPSWLMEVMTTVSHLAKISAAFSINVAILDVFIDLIAANMGMVIGRAIVKNRLLCFHITQSPFFQWSGSEKLAWRVAGHLFDFF